MRHGPPSVQQRGEEQQVAPSPAPGHPLIVPAIGLVLLALLTAVHGSWAAQVLLVPLLLIVPGVILLRALRISGAVVAENPVYVPAASVVVLMASGLAVDLIGPRFGVAAPLRAEPLLMTLEAVCMLLLLCSFSAPAETQIPWGELSNPARLAWPLLIPLLSVAGALRLNSGGSGHLAVFATLVVIILLVAGFLFAPWCDDSLLVVIVFAAALAMMWSFSLRGDLVYGFDISSEYYSLNQTVTSGVWHFSHPNDAYGAMLSVTLLPAQLHALSGMPALLIFKVVYPVIGSFFPVAVFCLARRVLTGRWAFMAAALVVMQQTFFQQLPALARQEVAMLLFAALIAAVLDNDQSRAHAMDLRWLAQPGHGPRALLHGLPGDPAARRRRGPAIRDLVVPAGSQAGRIDAACLRRDRGSGSCVVRLAYSFVVKLFPVRPGRERAGHQPAAEPGQQHNRDLPAG